MKHHQNTKPIKAFLIAIGFMISGLIMMESIGNKKAAIAEQQSAYDSLKQTIETHTSIIVNSYLLGVSILKETIE